MMGSPAWMWAGRITKPRNSWKGILSLLPQPPKEELGGVYGVGVPDMDAGSDCNKRKSEEFNSVSSLFPPGFFLVRLLLKNLACFAGK